MVSFANNKEEINIMPLEAPPLTTKEIATFNCSIQHLTVSLNDKNE